MNDLSSLPEAGPIRRVLALSYDSLIVVALTLSYVLLVVALTIVFTDAKVGEDVETNGLLNQLGWLIVIIGFFTYFWRRAGQTAGMKAWRLKLVSSDGQAPSIQQCILRCLLAPISIILAGLGYWWCWFDKDGRSAHDRLTNTRVLLLPKNKKS